MKKIILPFLCIIVSICFMNCKNDRSIFSNTNNTTVSTEVTTTYENVTIIEITYIVNINTGKFHYSDCPRVKQMSEKNKREYSGDRDGLVSRGYTPCKSCKP